MSVVCKTQNELLLKNLLEFYENEENLEKMLKIITGESKISLRIVDWFVTNYSKKYFTKYNIIENGNIISRFKVYFSYKLELKAYSKKRFDSFCRWERIKIPYKDGKFIETTLGQCNFFCWCLKNKVIEYIDEHYDEIDDDMIKRNSTSKKNDIGNSEASNTTNNNTKTRKKRQELSISATQTIRKEDVEIIVKFG